ncbi:RNase adapter RapZ [Acetivibrio saccincola]|uniref:GlmZ(SRNA)-inactivating NTPase n=1 Tax=Acetivibrio saccincola TaxID=1677857 RepID=A0A2K9E9M2_9FIRM|nr:RNase adapter RapZ [Acetivibrio saccincola]AUG58336.1 glmZ(sRNA)-inactivating NTPase [Acetivibrio saccincola]NLW27133.1 RNase adapter RapZ [Acetivibrio saccincola]PQQ65359.1 RNase adaptor protein RapZ [Acetivibrio saccincola]PQQ68212.1 RNase adaptor protein RapZ [Acetivibrio saccincola]PQQ68418.1 RNase adaptor protein RapZ [Acetivibrio saccincola]
MRLLIITGISGAGKSLVIKHLEDMGFYCVDNLPPLLIHKFVEICIQSRGKIDKIAMVIDIRGGELFNDLFPELKALKDLGILYEILFMEASDNVLIKRYKESRRTHPLSPEGRILEGIKKEREILKEIKKQATYIIDSSNLTPRQLKEELINIFEYGKKFNGIIINIISFGFKHGIPIDCDLVFDVRFIPNPYYIESMRNQTGKNELVRDYVLGFDETQCFLIKLREMLDFLIPNYIKEGKSQLVIGIGCTGGQHRSVAISEALFSHLSKKGHRVVINHRDMIKK